MADIPPFKPDFTSATFSESDSPWFDFALGVSPTPLPATLPLFATGLGALDLLGGEGSGSPQRSPPDRNK